MILIGFNRPRSIAKLTSVPGSIAELISVPGSAAELIYVPGSAVKLEERVLHFFL